MQDYLIRGVLPELALRVAWGEMPLLANQAVLTHDTDVAAAEVFVTALLAGAASAVQLDENEKYSIRFDYPGTVKMLLIESCADGGVRGLTRVPHLAQAGELDAESVFGSEPGTLAVTRSSNGRIRNSGQSNAPLADPGADLGFFFSTSDQLETEIRTRVEFQGDVRQPVRKASVLFLQALPGCDLEQFDLVRRHLSGENFTNSWRLLDATLAPDVKLRRLLVQLSDFAQVADLNSSQLKLEAGATPHWHCGCCYETMKRAMRVLGEKDLRELFSSNPTPSIECQFCRKRYSFKRDDFFASL